MEVLIGPLLTVGVSLAVLKGWLKHLDVRERVARLHSEEKDKERQHQITVAADDYKARHADRNILMIGQSELVTQIMAANENVIKVVCSTICRYREEPSNPQPAKEHSPDAPTSFKSGPPPII